MDKKRINKKPRSKLREQGLYVACLLLNPLLRAKHGTINKLLSFMKNNQSRPDDYPFLTLQIYNAKNKKSRGIDIIFQKFPKWI